MKKIALWGAGEAGKYILSNTSGLYEICEVIDNNVLNANIENIPVVTPQEYMEEPKDEIFGVLIGICNDFVVADIIKQVSEMGINNVGIFRKPIIIGEPLEWHDIIWFNPMEKAFWPYLETNVIDQCNLKCKGCSHFSNLFSNEDKEEETLEDLERDLKVLSQHVIVRKFRILGGEPFLSPNLKEYVEVARTFLPYTDIRIVTNGTLLMKAEDVLYECIREKNIILDISEYPPITEKKDVLKRYLDSRGIKYNFSQKVEEFSKYFDLQGKNAPLISHKKCTMNICRYLRCGKVYRCHLEGSIYKYARIYKIDELEQMIPHLGLDIHDENLDWVWTYHKLNKPGILCRFCDEKGGEPFSWGVSTNPKKEEWLVDRSEI